MTITGADYADSRIPASLLVSHGAKFAGRYVSEPGNNKNLHIAEADALTRSGIRIVTIGETSAARAMGGYANGQADANSFAEQAESVGQPHSTPIYYTVDFNTVPDTIDNVIEYFMGIHQESVPYKVGVYGGYNTVAAIHLHGLADYIFQTYAWSEGRWYATNHLRQVHNGVQWGTHTVDLCEAVTTDYGGWLRGGAAPAPAPHPPVPAPRPIDWTDAIMAALPELSQTMRNPSANKRAILTCQTQLTYVEHMSVGPSGVDGVYGPNTAAAVELFQRHYHLTVDGIVGPQTWSVLLTGTLR
jgi:peptidoglycan hydrolase-like protein with peptidoglycan-binding domain